MKLTPKQKRFVDEYLVSLNATQAAIRAGYSAKTARKIGQENLTKPDIQSCISERLTKLKESTEITQEKVLKEYGKISFFDPRKLFDEEGNLLPVHKLDADVAAAIGGVDVVCRKIGDIEIEITKKVKFIDKKGVLDSLAKHLGMFDGKGKLPDDPADITINYTDA